MDLVGLLPKSNRGHECIHVILDYATRYPEAFSLSTISNKGTAHESVKLLSGHIQGNTNRPRGSIYLKSDEGFVQDDENNPDAHFR